MKLRLILAAATIATAFAGTAHAGFIDGNKLFENLRRQVGNRQGLCLGYITGVADTPEGANCIEGVSAGQVHDAVKQYLESHPEVRHHTANSIVADAIKKAFCK